MTVLHRTDPERRMARFYALAVERERARQLAHARSNAAD
jgi:predicted DNA-binding WGR domain protein